MRPAFLPRPREEELRTRRSYELVRDYPELLPFLREKGVFDPGDGWARTLQELLPGTGPWISEVMARLAWRGPGSPVEIQRDYQES